MKTLNKAEMLNYVENQIANGANVSLYAKFARIQAVKAKGGEKLITLLANGKPETTNTANAGDWIVTNPGGEQYIVIPTVFAKKYEPAPELGDGWFKPTGGVQKFLELSEDLSFVCAWGEEQFIAKGGMINVTDRGDIYGIARDEFFGTYRKCDKDGKFC